MFSDLYDFAFLDAAAMFVLLLWEPRQGQLPCGHWCLQEFRRHILQALA